MAPEISPLFIADWVETLFMHCELDPRFLQAHVPFALDLWNGRAFVSLVAFTMRNLRLANLGCLGRWLCRPVATHEFLNLRTYVRYEDTPGICFLAEWLSNRLSAALGPLSYALPCRHAIIRYAHHGASLHGHVQAGHGVLDYEAGTSETEFRESARGSLDEFLLERYAAFNAGHSWRERNPKSSRWFRVAHAPWRQACATVNLRDDSLLKQFAPWWKDACPAGAHFSPGVKEVRMSGPRRL